MLTKDELQQMREVVRDEVKTEVEPLKQGQERLEQGQKEQNSAIVRLEQGVTQIKTVLKVLEAGQNDLRENMATKADIQDIKVEFVKHQRRIENLEEHTSTPNPHKN
jgi:uncharacterized phage infection (PIP) family protein YhgE